MVNSNFIKGLSIKEIFIVLAILISGIVYVFFVYGNTLRNEKEYLIQIARSVEVSLPKVEIKSLPENPEELRTKDFSLLKKSLQQIIQVNRNARFAYLYLQRNSKLYFIVDSESESSPDYSPAGQEFTEAEPIDSKPFQDGIALVTDPVTDRWGTWVSAEVPIVDDSTGKVIAVFGMDYDAKSWRNKILFEFAQSSLLVIIILILAFAGMVRRRKSEQLKREISLREIAEMGLKESESDYRLLFELNPQLMLVYDMETNMILAVNQATIDKYGYSKEEFLEMSILDLKSSDEFVRLWKKLIEDKHSLQPLEIWNHRLKDGSTIQVEVHSHNFDFRHKDARLILFIDITESLKTKVKIRANERHMTSLINNLPGIVYRCALDVDYTMNYISEGCTRITGYTPEDFMNKKIAYNDLILPEYRDPIWEKWQEVIQGKLVFEEEYPIINISGEIKWIWERGGGVFDENGELEFLEGYLEDITINKLAEEKLLQSEANLARTIEESPFGIRILSGDGTTLYANPALLGIFGFDSLNDFNQIPVSSWYTPECYLEYLAREASRKSGEDFKLDYEVRIISKKKGVRHLLVHRQEMLWNGEINNQLIYQDITDRKIAENQLIKLSSAIEQNPVSVVITNYDGSIEYVNPKFTEMTGYKSEEVLGKNPRILKSGKMDPQIYTDLWNTIISGKIWQGELINRNKSGEFYWAFKSISPIFDHKNQISNFVAIAEDITEKKKNEAELIKAKEKAEESDRLKSAFLANISHEIRTPMNGIMGFAELLKEPDLSPENQNEFIGVIEQSGQRMLNIINDLIDISKIEAGETILRIRETNVNKMLRELHLFFMPEVNQKNIYLDYHCDLPDDESMIETDITKLNQILTNLIKNAVKFTDKGSIKFGYKHKDKLLEFYIADTGPGIPQEQKDFIFERFRQGTQSLNKIHEGAGLGLAISKAYIELLGGSIWIESEFGKGSTFSFDTPIKQQPQ
jgi:PAS domain S-box-containing protein